MGIRLIARAFVAVLFLWALEILILAESRAEDINLEQLRQRHRLAVESIGTLHCRYATDYVRVGKQEPVHTGEYWRSASMFHSQEKFPGKREQLVKVWSVDSRRTDIINDRGAGMSERHYGTIQSESGQGSDPVLGKALFVFFGPDGSWLSFDLLLSKPHHLHDVSKIRDGDKHQIRVRLSHEKAKQDIWFDPQVNYLVRKVVTESIPRAGSKSKPEKVETEVTRFKEVTSGVFFPERVETRSLTTDSGVPRLTHISSFIEVRVNGSIPAEMFRVRYPPGIEVFDSIHDKVYKVGPDGNLIPQPNMRLAKTGSHSVGPTSQWQTVEEPLSSTRWILPASLALIFLGSGLWLGRRWWCSRRAVETGIRSSSPKVQP